MPSSAFRRSCVSCAAAVALPALWLILSMVFLLVHIVPGDPVAQMLGEGARAEDLQQLRHALDLDQPVRTQYVHYIAGIFHGDLGQSFRFQQPVLRVIADHYPATLQLSLVALAVCASIGIPVEFSRRKAVAPRRTPRSAC